MPKNKKTFFFMLVIGFTLMGSWYFWEARLIHPLEGGVPKNVRLFVENIQVSDNYLTHPKDYQRIPKLSVESHSSEKIDLQNIKDNVSVFCEALYEIYQPFLSSVGQYLPLENSPYTKEEIDILKNLKDSPHPFVNFTFIWLTGQYATGLKNPDSLSKNKLFIGGDIARSINFFTILREFLKISKNKEGFIKIRLVVDLFIREKYSLIFDSLKKEFGNLIEIDDLWNVFGTLETHLKTMSHTAHPFPDEHLGTIKNTLSKDECQNVIELAYINSTIGNPAIVSDILRVIEVLHPRWQKGGSLSQHYMDVDYFTGILTQNNFPKSSAEPYTKPSSQEILRKIDFFPIYVGRYESFKKADSCGNDNLISFLVPEKYSYSLALSYVQIIWQQMQNTEKIMDWTAYRVFKDLYQRKQEQGVKLRGSEEDIKIFDSPRYVNTIEQLRPYFQRLGQAINIDLLKLTPVSLYQLEQKIKKLFHGQKKDSRTDDTFDLMKTTLTFYHIFSVVCTTGPSFLGHTVLNGTIKEFKDPPLAIQPYDEKDYFIIYRKKYADEILAGLWHF